MSSPPIYTIQLPVYEGPLDLLLNLIEHAELDITKVSLAEVTDQYLVYIRQIQDRQLEDPYVNLVRKTPEMRWRGYLWHTRNTSRLRSFSLNEKNRDCAPTFGSPLPP